MFLGMLNEAQRNSFLALATQLVMADGEITPEEAMLLDLRNAEMGGNAKAPPQEVYGAPNIDVFDTPEVRRIVMLELIILAVIDHRLADDEVSVLADIASAFDISLRDIPAMRDWAHRVAPAIEEGWDMVKDGA